MAGDLFEVGFVDKVVDFLRRLWERGVTWSEGHAVCHLNVVGFSIGLHSQGNNGSSLVAVGSLSPFRTDQAHSKVQENSVFMLLIHGSHESSGKARLSGLHYYQIKSQCNQPWRG